MRRYVWILIPMSLIVFGSACRPQVSLTASRDRINRGEEVELSWTSKRAQTVTLNARPVAKSGTMKVTPTETTTYEAVARRGKREARALARVEVIQPRPTISLSVDPPRIERGQQATLRWSSTDAETVEISGLGPVEPSGSRSVSPPQTTTYTAIARGPGGEATASATLTVTEPAPPPPPPPPPSPPRNISAEFAEAVTTIYFAFDSAELDEEAQARLRRAAEWLNRPENRTIVFRIEGHCDERGTEEYNMALGDRRAHAARDFLISLGIAPERIQTVSFGETRPAVPESNERAWALNRRDEFVYIQGGETTPPRR